MIVGDGGVGGRVPAGAARSARVFSRRGDWPPDVGGADLVVNATSARDEVLVELAPGQTLVELPYPDTRDGASPPGRPARPSSAGSRCSSRRERRRSSSGRDCRRRVDVMRAAVDLAP